jgi:hypothetical protein
MKHPETFFVKSVLCHSCTAEEWEALEWGKPIAIHRMFRKRTRIVCIHPERPYLKIETFVSLIDKERKMCMIEEMI